MPYNGKFHDPFCKKEFWINHLSDLSPNKLETCLTRFDIFKKDLEEELRIVMSPAREVMCRDTLEELVRGNIRQYKNRNQGDLF